MTAARMEQNRREFLQVGALGLLGLTVRAASAAPAVRFVPPDVSDLSCRVPFFRRSQWTASRPRFERLRPATGFDRVTVHHAGAEINCHLDRSRVVYDLHGVLDSHVQRRYGDIGYHFIVDYAGRAWEGRSLAYQGAHVLHENRCNIGIMLLGNFEEQKPSREQVVTLARLSGFLMDRYEIKKRRLYGHRDLGQSLCPGKYLYAFVMDLKS